MFNYKLIIEFDGLNFFGWQKQKLTHNTIQEHIESAASKILKKEIKLTGAGRTDAKVSAYNQVANFKTENKIDINKFRHSLNSLMDSEITIKKISKVKNDFHSRYSAKRREYIYKITTKKKSLEGNYFYRINYVPDFEKIDNFMEFILKQNYFRSLCKNKEDKQNFNCEIFYFNYKKINSGNEILFKIAASRFLHSMVRAIIGCTLDISRGIIDPEIVKQLIKKGEKFKIHYLPAHALFLNKIYY